MAGENSIQVTISNGGTDLTAYLVKLQKQATDTNRKLQDDGKVQNRIAQDQLKLLNDQLNTLTKLSNLEITMARRRNDFYRDQRQAELDLQRIRAKNVFSANVSNPLSLSGVGRVDWSYSTSRQNMGLDAGRQGSEQFDELTRAVNDTTDAIRNASQLQINQMSSSSTSIVAAIEAVKEEVKNLGGSISGAGGSGGGGGDGPDLDGYRYDKAELAQHLISNPGRSPRNAAARLSFLAAKNNPDTYTGLASMAAEQYTNYSNAENSFQKIKYNSENIWGGVGAVAGAAIGFFAGNPVIGGMAGYQIGKSLGGAVGEQDQKKAIAQQEFQEQINYLNGLTGGAGNIEIPTLNQYGISRKEVAQIKGEMAKNSSMADSNRYTREAVSLNKAYSLPMDKLTEVVSLQGTNKDGYNSLTGFVSRFADKSVKSGMLKSNDYTGLADLIGKHTTLQKAFLENQLYMPTGRTADIMGRFQAVGGMFSMTDPRGMSNAMAVQEGLSHPGSEVMDTMSFAALRSIAPNAGMFELMKMKEQGLGGDHGIEYMNAMLKMSHKMGNDDYGKAFVAEAFPNMPLAAAEELYNNTDAFKGATNNEYLDKFINSNKIDNLARGNTTQMNRETAESRDEKLKGIAEEKKVLDPNATAAQIAAAITTVFEGATIKLDNGEISFNKTPAKSNEKSLTGKAFQNSLQWYSNHVML
ncbi:hypothetical protein [Chitinophaga sp. Cy-1792]|uniref:hypothetical protein n=1 Tax=Chitinophaga sp. Cy-1792 TaxID=2608339 RepID=UPI0014241BFB|nr:hypothetical protein [Chitinophaga sp. Cy-1792]NIG54741.1 hypothetical protein [Chitinophaga sp. Cy-1792]